MNISLSAETLYLELFGRAKELVFRTALPQKKSVAHDLTVDFIYSDTLKLFDSSKGSLEQFFVAYVLKRLKGESKIARKRSLRFVSYDRPKFRNFHFGNKSVENYSANKFFVLYYDRFEKIVESKSVLNSCKELLADKSFSGVNLSQFLDLLIESTERLDTNWSNKVYINLSWCSKQLGKGLWVTTSIYNKMMSYLCGQEVLA